MNFIMLFKLLCIFKILKILMLLNYFKYKLEYRIINLFLMEFI